jgi:hypothetical protein
MTMYLRALYLSILICAAIAAAACRFGTGTAQCGPGCGANGWTVPALQSRWRAYRAGLQRRVAALAPHAGAGFIAAALLRLSVQLARRGRRASRLVRDEWQCDVLLPAGDWEFAAFDGTRSRACVRNEDARMSPVEREAFAWLAEHPDIPLDAETTGSERLIERCRADWATAAATFGAGTLESQLSVLRHLGKLLGYVKDPAGPGRYTIESDPRPLATQALRELQSFRDMPPEERRELMRALYTLQSGWKAQDLPARVVLAVDRLRASGAGRPARPCKPSCEA